MQLEYLWKKRRSPKALTEYADRCLNVAIALHYAAFHIMIPSDDLLAAIEYHKSVSAFRIQAKTILCTWPRCDEDPALVLQRIEEEFRDQRELEFVIVAREHHQDNGLHLHAVIKFAVRYYSSRSTCSDFATGKHGNYQAVRSLKDTLAYVCKEDDWVASAGFDPRKYIRLRTERKPTKSAIIAQALRDGASFDSVVKEYPGFALMHLGKVRAFYQLMQMQRLREGLLDWKALSLSGS